MRPTYALAVTQRLEEASALDGAVRGLEPYVHTLFGSGRHGALLRGDWLGHPLHPMLTDVVLGTWWSATFLDVVGRGRWSAPAQAVVTAGFVAFGPTAWAGWAQWDQAGAQEKRVGVVHAVTMASAFGAYVGSWFARRAGRHETAARRALIGAGITVVGGYLGGHLAAARRERA